MKTSVFTKTLLAVFLVSVIISGYAHAEGVRDPYDPDSYKTTGPTYIYMNQKAASTVHCENKGLSSIAGKVYMYKYECKDYFELKSHGVTDVNGYYRTCSFSGSNSAGSHTFRASTEFGNACSYGTGSSDNIFYAIVNL